MSVRLVDACCTLPYTASQMPESTRPIRALFRGLDALAALNLRDGATVTEIAAEIGLPRTTTYRILETLCEAGYAFRDPADERYRLKMKVLALSHGFSDEAWVADIARPLLRTLGRDLAWPVAVATRSGTTMLVREIAERQNPETAEALPPGSSVPLLGSAAGRVYLAHCPRAECEALLARLADSGQEADALAREPVELQRLLDEARRQGFVTAVRSRRASDEVTMAVPVQGHDRVLAAVSVRYAASAVSAGQAQQQFLPKLRDVAAAIHQRYASEERPAQQPAATPRSN